MKRESKKKAISSTSSSAMEPDRSETTKDSSCYFPGCRKDANCTCDICLASINATLDLMRLPNLNPPPPPPPIPLYFDSPSAISTPQITIRPRPRDSPLTPCLKSTARAAHKAPTKPVMVDEVKKKNRSKFGKLVLRFVILILGIEIGLPWVVNTALRPELSPEIVRDLGKKAFALNDMNGKLRMLQSDLQRSVHAPISNCSSNTPAWRINQDGLLLSTQCVLYKSVSEQVSIWGWPLQTAGLLASRFSSRSFTVLSGRVTQWPEGNGGYVTMAARGSWVQDKYRASAVQLDGQTWVLEYSRSALLDKKGFCSATWEFLKYRLSRAYEARLGWIGARFRGYSAVDGVHSHPT